MARILLTWELGSGLGHLTRLRPLVEHLTQAGHQIHLAVRNLASFEAVFSDARLCLYQAPIALGKPTRHIRCPLTFSHLMHNCGFSDESELYARIKAWDRLYRMIDPDMVICDHSPTALAAARGLSFPKVAIGSSFFCPPDECPLPTLQPWRQVSPSILLKEELHTVDIINAALEKCEKPAIENLAKLYHDCNLMLLTTFKELDHFGQRPGIRYFGAWPTFPGEAPDWPKAPGKRIYAYLKQSPQLLPLLDELKRLQHPTLVYGDWVTEGIAEKHGCSTLRLATRPLDLKQAAAESDLAILHGTHGATAAMLLGGTPTLQLPIFLEQHLLARRVVSLGAATMADPDSLEAVMAGLRQMLATQHFTAAANRFAATYSRVQPERQLGKMMHEVELLLPKTAPPPEEPVSYSIG